MPQDLTYFTSEQFIHDDLARIAARLEERVRADWRKDRRVDSHAFSWPSETIKTDDGGQVSNVVMMYLPDSLTAVERSMALKRMVEKTKAYGIALTERRGDELRVLFESHHGARAWVIPLERHGDVLIPGRTRVHDNAECLGLLWSPHQGVS